MHVIRHTKHLLTENMRWLTFIKIIPDVSFCSAENNILSSQSNMWCVRGEKNPKPQPQLFFYKGHPKEYVVNKLFVVKTRAVQRTIFYMC